MGSDFGFGAIFASIMIMLAALVLVVVLTAGTARRENNGYYNSTSLVLETEYDTLH